MMSGVWRWLAFFVFNARATQIGMQIPEKIYVTKNRIRKLKKNKKRNYSLEARQGLAMNECERVICNAIA